MPLADRELVASSLQIEVSSFTQLGQVGDKYGRASAVNAARVEGGRVTEKAGAYLLILTPGSGGEREPLMRGIQIVSGIPYQLSALPIISRIISFANALW